MSAVSRGVRSVGPTLVGAWSVGSRLRPMTSLLGVDSIAAELRACTPDELHEVRASFAVVAADPDGSDWWRALAAAAILAIDRMAEGVDPAVTLRGLERDLMAAREAALAGDGVLAASRSRARRRRRGPP